VPTPTQLLADLARAFPRHPVTSDTLRVYLRELDDVAPADLERAVRELIRKSEFFPTVRAIREVAAENALDLPTGPAALAQVDARIAWAKDDEDARDGEPPVVHDLVREAVELAGGYGAFRAAGRPDLFRSQFLKLYAEIRANAILYVQVGGRELDAGATRPELER
jgi:hypothetical protein